MKMFLIDGHALIFKMYYAFLSRPMINSKGEDMSILYGFTKYLLELIAREQPTHVAVAFDPPGGTFRNQLYPEYKANRTATPQLVIDALEPLTELCHSLNIPTLMVPGFEADDVIGSMAKRSQGEGFDVYMVTPDKDYGQLIDTHIWQYKPGKAGGDKEILGIPEVCAKYGIQTPVQVIELLTLCGDASDNVPGVKGVGEVGASKLIGAYGTVENIYAHLDELTPRQRQLFEEARPHIRLSHDLVTIKTDIELDTTAEDMRLDTRYDPHIVELFDHYEFTSLNRFIAHIARPEAPAEAPVAVEVRQSGPDALAAAARKTGKLGLQLRDSTLWLSADGNVCPTTARQAAALLGDATIAKYGYDLKKTYKEFAASGIPLEGKLMDIELMHYLLNPERSHALDLLAKTYLNVEIAPVTQAVQTGSLFDDEPAEEAKDDTPARQAAVMIDLGERLREELEKAGVLGLYDKMEEPLIRVLARMETAGIRMDLDSLRDFAAKLREEIARRETAIREMAGEPDLNVGSPKQIGVVLFEKLGLDKKAKKSASGQYTTDETTLLALADKHPIIGEILEYRAAKKLLSTYIEPFPSYVSPADGKIHTTFNQALTATGRLSSSNPNLQNIPIRTERGREIRKAFVPGTPDGVIVSADYSQIELRIMAHLSCDEHLVSAFREGMDVHRATAAKIFHIPPEEVTKEQRGIAKTANFGIMYGISAFGLAQRLGSTRFAAKKIIDDYFENFPSISSYIEAAIAGARENGYVETLFGRRRYLPDINARNANARALAERNAVNAPIQGTSADIIKLAMIAVDRRIREEGLRSRMVLQIHDELVFDAVPEEVSRLKEIVVHEMEHVMELSVPLTVECNEGKNWLEAH